MFRWNSRHGHVTEETPEIQMERKRDTERIAHALCGLWEVQRRRLLMLADGKSMREIAREEYPKGHPNLRMVKGMKEVVLFAFGGLNGQTHQE